MAYENFPPEIHPANYEMKRNPAKAQVSATDSNAVTSEELQKLDAMSKHELIALIKRVSGAIWGIGMMTEQEQEEALLTKFRMLALARDDAKEIVALGKEYFDRKRGKPMQSVDINQKIGIVAIVMEAAKQRKSIEGSAVGAQDITLIQ